MALISQIPVAEVAAVVARSLETLIGHDVVLTTGAPELGDPTDDILPEGGTRTIVLPFADGLVGEVTLVISEPFAMAMEAATDDASLTTAALPALEAGASAIALILPIGVNVADSGEIATETLLTSVVGEFAAVAILENDTRVACLVVRIVDDEPVEIPTPVPAAAPTIPAPTVSAPPLVEYAEAELVHEVAPPESAPYAAAPYEPAPYEAAQPESAQPEPAPPEPPPYVTTPEIAPAAAMAPPASAPSAEITLPAADPRLGIAIHEFQPLGEGGAGAGAARPLALLNDVNMQVTAELGRRRLKVRDIVALQPGSVVELDRAAGSPVDVLVNGALVWHGEVVVVDEEFGIRVSEIVVDEN